MGPHPSLRSGDAPAARARARASGSLFTAAKIEFYRRKVTKHRALARASPATDLSTRINALPTELVWKIISFWRTAREAPGNLLD